MQVFVGQLGGVPHAEWPTFIPKHGTIVELPTGTASDQKIPS
jgi:hypothetical protein